MSVEERLMPQQYSHGSTFPNEILEYSVLADGGRYDGGGGLLLLCPHKLCCMLHSEGTPVIVDILTIYGKHIWDTRAFTTKNWGAPCGLP